MPATQTGSYQDCYIKRNDALVSLKSDVTDFCEKYIRPVHPENWDWSIRDFENEENDPTIEEARAVRDLIYLDMTRDVKEHIDLSTINNAEAIKAYLHPGSKHEEFNMQEFAFALKVELEHGRIKEANVTNNHPFLTALIALAHMSETLTYYARLRLMEAEAEVYEIGRKRALNGTNVDKELEDAQKEVKEAQDLFTERLKKMDDIPALTKIGD